VQVFDDPARTIHVAAGEAFAVVLAGNPTTGYTWQADVDDRCLALISQEFEPGGPGAGAGGREVLRFEVRGSGETEITCEYKRPWEAEARNTKRFKVVIVS
jgi:predicted secreted protein